MVLYLLGSLPYEEGHIATKADVSESSLYTVLYYPIRYCYPGYVLVTVEKKGIVKCVVAVTISVLSGSYRCFQCENCKDDFMKTSPEYVPVPVRTLYTHCSDRSAD